MAARLLHLLAAWWVADKLALAGTAARLLRLLTWGYLHGRPDVSPATPLKGRGLAATTGRYSGAGRRSSTSVATPTFSAGKRLGARSSPLRASLRLATRHLNGTVPLIAGSLVVTLLLLTGGGWDLDGQALVRGAVTSDSYYVGTATPTQAPAATATATPTPPELVPPIFQAAGDVVTLAGSAGSGGSTDGTGSSARFNDPRGVAVDSSGTVYVADRSNYSIRVVTAAGVVSTLAGQVGSFGSDDGTGSAARFSFPEGVAVDIGGTVYVADTVNHTIRKVTPSGVVTTLAGSAGNSGSADGTGSTARFNSPFSVAVDSGGMVYVADGNNHTIRKVTTSGVVTTLAGFAGSSGSTDGTGSSARFNGPRGVAVDGSGAIYVADTNNHAIRKVTAAGVVTTLAGQAGSFGSDDGVGTAARFKNPLRVAVDNDGTVYVSDFSNHTIRRITASGVVTTLAGSAGISGSADGTSSSARFNGPVGVAVAGTGGTLFVADRFNNTIRRVEVPPASTPTPTATLTPTPTNTPTATSTPTNT
ncbi:MAG: hypothetical protein CL878_01800, partial [Dehalococcoidia bacterium]|nr:hypothetical protein [Dehalococcoidia bacterium]